MSKQPPPAPNASAVSPCPTIIQISRTPRRWKFIQHHRTTRPPPLFQSISSRLTKRGRKRRERIEESKNVQTTPTRTYCKRSRPLPYCIQIVGRPGTGSLPSTIAPPDHPRTIKGKNLLPVGSKFFPLKLDFKFQVIQSVLLK